MCQIWGHYFHIARNPLIWPVSPIQNWTRVTRWTPKDPTAARITGSLDHYSAPHYSDVIMSAMASKITSVLIVYSTVCSGADQRKHKSSASLVCVRGIHRGPVNSPHKRPMTPKMFPFDDVILSLCCIAYTSLWLPIWCKRKRKLFSRRFYDWIPRSHR